MSDTGLPRLWKINCMEDEFPGMWQRWYKNQCVGLGWPPADFQLEDWEGKDRGWSHARNVLAEMREGDWIVVSLRGHRVGRLGEVTRIAIADAEWDPLVPRSTGLPDGEMGRRILVRWDLNAGPDDREYVVELPEGSRLTAGELRHAISEVRSQDLATLRRVMNQRENWVGILPRFAYERSLSDYIAAYPHRLEDGLLPHPNDKVRERLFSDRRRADVILLDRDQTPVIVECKQHQPTTSDIEQLRHYMNKLGTELRTDPRGILVHGGARRLRREVRALARSKPRVELVQYRVEVDFLHSS